MNRFDCKLKDGRENDSDGNRIRSDLHVIGRDMYEHRQSLRISPLHIKHLACE